MLLEVSLAGGDELQGNQLEAVSLCQHRENKLSGMGGVVCPIGVLPARLEAGDDGANEATLSRY